MSSRVIMVDGCSPFKNLLILNRHFVVPIFPFTAYRPVEREPDRRLLRFRDRDIDESDAEGSRCGERGLGCPPLVSCPLKLEGSRRLDAQDVSPLHRAGLTIRLPYLEQLVPLRFVKISV